MKILAVDDEPGILSSLRRELFENDHEFTGASSAEEGLKHLTGSESFHVVISDHLMPGMKGIEFLARVQTIQPQALRILLTGQVPGDLLSSAIQAGTVDFHILKPWTSDLLIELIETYGGRIHA